MRIKLYKNHGKEIGYWIGKAEGSTVHMTHSRNLNGAEVTRSYEAEGKNIGKSNETTPEQQAILEVESRARKKRDEGYVDSLEEAKQPATNSLGLKKPMLATPIGKVKLTDDHFLKHWCFVQPKLDGHRALWCPNSKTLYSRQGKPLNLPHIEERLRNSEYGKHHLDGELYVHGLELQEISRLVKKYRPGESEQVSYHIYDLVSKEPFEDRMLTLNQLNHHDHIQIVDTYPVMNMDDVENLHQDHRDLGYEGTMLRISGKGYEDGKRSKSLLKIKNFYDEEFEIVGCIAGKQTTLNGNSVTPAVWICKAHNGETFQVLSQGGMENKHILYLTHQKHIGKMLTVKYHYLSKDGIPQLPVALRFREDI